MQEAGPRSGHPAISTKRAKPPSLLGAAATWCRQTAISRPFFALRLPSYPSMPRVWRNLRFAKLRTATVALSLATCSNIAKPRLFLLYSDRPLTIQWDRRLLACGVSHRSDSNRKVTGSVLWAASASAALLQQFLPHPGLPSPRHGGEADQICTAASASGPDRLSGRRCEEGRNANYHSA